MAVPTALMSMLQCTDIDDSMSLIYILYIHMCLCMHSSAICVATLKEVVVDLSSLQSANPGSPRGCRTLAFVTAGERIS